MIVAFLNRERDAMRHNNHRSCGKRSRVGSAVPAPLALVLTGLLTGLPIETTQAEDPLYVRNLAPVAGLFGLPSQRDAATAGAGRWSIDLHGSVASHYVLDTRNSEESLKQDGETRRLALDLRYGIGERWELQLELPWVQHSGGSLDSLINNWHDLWGLSDGGRSKAAKDELDYRYRGPETAFSLQDDSAGIGDTSLALHYRFFADDNASAALSAGYKFASGDEQDFTGSGADDVYLALRFSGAHLADLPLTWHGQLGYLYAGDGDLLGGAQQNQLWFAGLALDWQLAESWSLLAQLDSHAAPMDSDLDALGRDALLLGLGARWRFAPGWAVDFSFVEDLQVDSAPDVTFQASLRYRGN